MIKVYFSSFMLQCLTSHPYLLYSALLVSLPQCIVKSSVQAKTLTICTIMHCAEVVEREGHNLSYQYTDPSN